MRNLLIFMGVFLVANTVAFFLNIYFLEYSVIRENKNSFRYLRNIPCKFMISKEAESVLKELIKETA